MSRPRRRSPIATARVLTPGVALGRPGRSVGIARPRDPSGPRGAGFGDGVVRLIRVGEDRSSGDTGRRRPRTRGRPVHGDVLAPGQFADGPTMPDPMKIIAEELLRRPTGISSIRSASNSQPRRRHSLASAGRVARCDWCSWPALRPPAGTPGGSCWPRSAPPTRGFSAACAVRLGWHEPAPPELV